MAAEGIFDIFTIPILFEKLRHNQQRVTSSPSDRWAAIDFVLTADNLRHWATIAGKHGKTATSPVVQICRDLANGSKHWRHRRYQTRDSKVVGGAFQFGAFDANAFDVGSLVVVLKDEAERQFGPEIGTQELATKTVEFWQAELGL